MHKTALQWINSHRDELVTASDRIWDLAEVGFQEHQSAALLVQMLKDNGFSVEEGVAGMPTAFVASFGSGKPVIGILGEYDALPGLSQTTDPEKKPLCPGKPGHGCGHNLLGVGALGGALAVKEAMVHHKLAGTIRFYGCPAEETLSGKVYMVRDGLFDDCDATLTWHPSSVNGQWAASSMAMNSVKFTFHGRTAHAAGDPENGRSALDAVELMNVAANYLREHVPSDARIHYVITKGGGEPNVVPGEAQVWYYVRAPKRPDVDEIYARMLKIAEGAALMTETTFDVEFLTGCYNTLQNEVIGDLYIKNMQEVGAPQFTDEEIAWAKTMASNFAPLQREKSLKAWKKNGIDFADKYICDQVLPVYDRGKVSAGSTDVGDVSFVTPNAQFTTACQALGTAGHSWQYAAAAGMSIGHKGMVYAAQILALTGLDLLTQPETLAKAQEEFTTNTKDEPYKSPLPAGQQPPLHQLTHH